MLRQMFLPDTDTDYPTLNMFKVPRINQSAFLSPLNPLSPVTRIARRLKRRHTRERNHTNVAFEETDALV